ncbi:hypothetical protein [Ketobacter nezhaii]|uniref:hypothetical protein n=1 Tax=Ketobacter sp. MCCC 1A13808 TaxID=2602738 RepID=UPI0012EB6782|nr:hypothetical protein [Ketobacter sp. MCCC 1A13808]
MENKTIQDLDKHKESFLKQAVAEGVKDLEQGKVIEGKLAFSEIRKIYNLDK